MRGGKVGGEVKWHRRGCTILRTSPNLLTTRLRGNSAYVDLATQSITPLFGVRAACSNNLFPANGVLSVPNLMGGCTCNYTPTSMAFVPVSAIER